MRVPCLLARMSSVANHDNAELARRCRALAEATYRLADQADVPEIIADYLAIAAKLLALAAEYETDAEPAPLRRCA